MVINRNSLGRRSIRLPGFDYSQPGAYFLTICTVERRCIFGGIDRGKLHENTLGQLIRACWLQIPDHFHSVETDEFVIMPNHLHAILNIKRASLQNGTPRREAFSAPIAASIPTIVRTFKAEVTRQAHKHGIWLHGPIWQRDYFERVIRDRKEYFDTCRYIQLNPLRWNLDENHPSVLGQQQPRLCRGGTIYRAPTDANK